MFNSIGLLVEYVVLCTIRIVALFVVYLILFCVGWFVMVGFDCLVVFFCFSL